MGGVMDDQISIASFRAAIEKLFADRAPEPMKMTLYGGPNQIAIWRKMFGDSVEYHEHKPIPR